MTQRRGLEKYSCLPNKTQCSELKLGPSHITPFEMTHSQVAPGATEEVSHKSLKPPSLENNLIDQSTIMVTMLNSRILSLTIEGIITFLHAVFGLSLKLPERCKEFYDGR